MVASILATAAMAESAENANALKDKDVDRIDFIHYKGSVRPAKGVRPETCYKLMGVKWNPLPVSYVINPNNPQNLPQDFVTSAISTSAETWDNAMTRELFNDVYSISPTATYGVRDYQNSIVFGPYSGSSSVIAVTSVWYNRKTKAIIEFDILFNTAGAWTWGDGAADSSLMDLQNIATHELGHSVGLSDLYTLACSTVTMYGYSDNGDTSKRTLEPADVTGLQKMYGV
ncbi:MAG: matrixin family metalloprotease [Candidatus Altiarchaeota archaeon]